MLAIISTNIVYSKVKELNINNLFKEHRITLTAIPAIEKEVREISASRLLIDIDGMRDKADGALDLVDRLSKSNPTLKIIIVACNADPESRTFSDFKALGVNDFIFDDLKGIGRGLTNILYSEGLLYDQMPQQPYEKPHAEKREVFLGGDYPAVKSLPIDVTAPSEMSISERKERKQGVKPPLKKGRDTLTLAVCGCGSRIGCTTQALQMALYLHIKEESVALVQINAVHNLAAYVPMMQGCIVIDEEHYTVNGLHLFKSGASIAKAKRMFEYVVIDYGNIHDMSDLTSFLDKDVCVAVGGVKPWETQNMEFVFRLDMKQSANIQYIFTHVPSHDKRSVIESMADSKDKSHFADYTPDYWTYNGQDEMYARIISYVPKAKPKKSVKGFKFPWQKASDEDE